MSYEVISPLGKRNGFGTFDTFWKNGQLQSLEEALSAGDEIVAVNFVKNQDGIIFFEAYRTDKKDDKVYLRLEIQHFPAGIDVRDDANAMELANILFSKP